MLDISRNITLTGKSLIDGVQAETYSAVIRETNPLMVNISSTITNKDLREANTETCDADRQEFSDTVYEIQQEMLGGKTVVSEDSLGVVGGEVE